MFGSIYQESCLKSLGALAYSLVEKICKKNTTIFAKWGLPFLAVGQSDKILLADFPSSNHSELLDAMVARIHELETFGVYCSVDEKAEISVLCELLSSFQVVIDADTTTVIPLAHALSVNDLFDAIISQPMISLPNQSIGSPKILLIDGLDVTFDSTGGNTILRLVRLISLRSQDWIRVVITSRCHGDQLSKEIDDLHPHVVHLYGDNHLQDIVKICHHLLESKEYIGDIEDGVDILLQKSDSCIHYIHFLQLYLQQRPTRRNLLQISMNIDIHKFTLVRAFSSEASRNYQRAKAVLEVKSSSISSI